MEFHSLFYLAETKPLCEGKTIPHNINKLINSRKLLTYTEEHLTKSQWKLRASELFECRGLNAKNHMASNLAL